MRQMDTVAVQLHPLPTRTHTEHHTLNTSHHVHSLGLDLKQTYPDSSQQ